MAKKRVAMNHVTELRPTIIKRVIGSRERKYNLIINTQKTMIIRKIRQRFYKLILYFLADIHLDCIADAFYNGSYEDMRLNNSE
jgi:hypothetical protein